MADQNHNGQLDLGEPTGPPCRTHRKPQCRRARVQVAILALLLAAGLVSGPAARGGDDLREYQHGIDFITRDNAHPWLIWSSSGNPPTGADPHGNWTHDVYYSEIDPANPQIAPTTIITRYEAQEPASSAIAANGNIMITMEDGWNAANEIAQRYGVYDRNLDPVRPYPNLVLDGGHSGHVAAAGNHFVVFYSEGWVDGGGVDDLGSGDDVLLKVYDANGNPLRSKNVAVGGATRDWWPLVAGSPDHAMLLWQRFVGGQTDARLMYSVYDPAAGSIVRAQAVVESGVKYYTYDVQAIPALDRFLITGTYDSGGGFAYLADNDGTIVAQNLTLPAGIREAQPAIQQGVGAARVVYPMSPGGIMVLSVTATGIAVDDTIDGYHWQWMGTDGIFTDSHQVYFASLSQGGVVGKTFALDDLLGDMDTDGDVDFDDIGAFVLGLTRTANYEAAYGVPVFVHGDIDADGDIDFDDIPSFVSLVNRAGGGLAVPEPATLGLAGCGCVLLAAGCWPNGFPRQRRGSGTFFRGRMAKRYWPACPPRKKAPDPSP